MDSSAAHAIAKLKKIIHRLFHVEISIFVTGSDRGGFPCEFALSEALARNINTDTAPSGVDDNSIEESNNGDGEVDLDVVRDGSRRRSGSISVSRNTKSFILASKVLKRQTDGRVCESLDDALKFAEDILIARADPQHQFVSRTDLLSLVGDDFDDDEKPDNLTLEEERQIAKKYMKDLLEYYPNERSQQSNFMAKSVDLIVSMMKREEYKYENILWQQGEESGSLKIIVSGTLVSIIEETGALEPVVKGNMVGELGLVNGQRRLTTLMCSSPTAVLYSLDRDSWMKLKKDHPRVASLVDEVVIRYLAHRVQHVSNRYFHTTLPV